MKKWKMKIGVIAILLAAASLSAQVNQKGKEKFKAMHKELRAYAEQNILPVMKELRLKLDQQLTDEEKSTIAELREKMHTNRKEHREEMKQFHEKLKSGEISKEEAHEQFIEKRKAHKEAMEPIHTIADKHEDAIKALLDEAKGNKDTWKEGMEAIRKKYISDEELEEMKEKRHEKRKEWKKEDGDHGPEGPHGPHHMRKGHHDKGMKGGHHMGKLHRNFNPIGFLMWDPNAPMPDFDETEEPADFEVFPNPSNSTNTINYDVSKKGAVKIELLDRQGAVLKTIVNEEKEAGAHSVEINLENMPNAVYYYRVTTVAGSKTKRFLINK